MAWQVLSNLTRLCKQGPTQLYNVWCVCVFAGRRKNYSLANTNKHMWRCVTPGHQVLHKWQEQVVLMSMNCRCRAFQSVAIGMEVKALAHVLVLQRGEFAKRFTSVFWSLNPTPPPLLSCVSYSVSPAVFCFPKKADAVTVCYNWETLSSIVTALNGIQICEWNVWVSIPCVLQWFWYISQKCCYAMNDTAFGSGKGVCPGEVTGNCMCVDSIISNSPAGLSVGTRIY